MTVDLQSRDVSSTFALSTDVSLRRRRNACYALDLDGRVRALVARALATGHFLASFVAEVDPARQLAHKNQIDALQALGAQRRGRGKRWMHAHRTQIRVDSQFLAEAEQALLGAQARIWIVPARATHGAQQDGVG